ncbi:MAG: hypothetical protein V3W19_08020 [Desulfatiglandales bacterium]
MRLPKVYATNHIHSKVVSAAFAEGCEGSIVPPVRLLEGPAIVYGVLRGCGEIIKQCEWIHRDYYHIDHGYFLRGHYEGYYRVTKNGLQSDGWGKFNPKRFEDLKVPLRPWKRTGRHIVICPLSKMAGEFINVDPKKWVETVLGELSLHTDRPIIVKYKDDKPISSALEDAWCLVTHSSNAGVDAVVSGVPVIALGHSACLPVSWDIEDIESPHWPAREQWTWNLASNQWTLEEMRSGEAWKMLD